MSKYKSKKKKKSAGSLARQALMTGVSYVVPIVVAGGTIQALALIFGGVTAVGIPGSIAFQIKAYGGWIMALMVPIISAYIAYSLGDKVALAPGFAAGLAAREIGAGFLGGIASGFIAGYLLKYMKMVKINKNFVGLMNFFVYPVVGSFVAGLIMLFVIGKPIAAINTGLTSWLQGLSGINSVFLGLIIGAMTCFDMGGPVNKAAYAFVIGLLGTGLGGPYAAMKAAISVPDFAITLATFFFAKYFTEEERETGKSTWILGIAGITEGAIPFALGDPLTVIPAMMIGGGTASAIAMFGGVSVPTAGGGIFTIPLMSNALWFVIALIVGSVVSFAFLVLFKRIKYNRKVKEIAVEETNI